MPYRRLPNTDQARIRALKAVVVKGDICNVYDLAVSLKALTDARNFLTKFEAAQAYYADCFERCVLKGIWADFIKFFFCSFYYFAHEIIYSLILICHTKHFL